MNNYNTLVNVLDKIRHEAPPTLKRYMPPENKPDEVNNARSRAFIHLYLKVMFGLLDFTDREEYVTDDPQDGGIDGYFLCEESKIIYFIQSKFRMTEKNFNDKCIQYSELIQMDTTRIIDGQDVDDKGVPYNDKIKKILEKLKNIQDIGRWKYIVILLANVPHKLSDDKLKRLTGGFPVEVYNHSRVFQELIFPVIQGTYYTPSELILSLNLSNTSSQSAKVTYKVITKNKECDITLVFVPTIEIAKAMYKYRNSMLKFNPRSYLELYNNDVNKAIASSIIDIESNEFALYNNGITILSYGTDVNEKIGQKAKGQLIIKQPQIINGGQTAYTLSRLYEDHYLKNNQTNIFENKEVLLKIITFQPDEQASPNSHLELIEAISKATNQQTAVNEADRRSNAQIQVQLQKFLFDKYGYFYERKRGEYADGLKDGYIQRSQIIERELFLRMCKCCDMEPSAAKRMGVEQLFYTQHFEKTLADPNRFEEYYFAYSCYQILQQIKNTFSNDKSNKFGFQKYGSGLQFGMYAIVTACCFVFENESSLQNANTIITTLLNRWLKFEEYAVKQPENGAYFREQRNTDTGEIRMDMNFNNYYKGTTLIKNLRSFFIT